MSPCIRLGRGRRRRIAGGELEAVREPPALPRSGSRGPARYNRAAAP